MNEAERFSDVTALYVAYRAQVHGVRSLREHRVLSVTAYIPLRSTRVSPPEVHIYTHLSLNTVFKRTEPDLMISVTVQWSGVCCGLSCLTYFSCFVVPPQVRK